jgi:PAS domain S-box-containing protein
VNFTEQDTFYTSAAFQAFFNSSRRSLVMRADAPRFTILAASDQYLSLVHKQRSELLGKGLFEVFPGSRTDIAEQHSVEGSFNRVIKTREPDELPVFKYEIFVPETAQMETYYWSNLNEPVMDETGQVAYVINSKLNITDQINQKNALQEALNQVKTLQREQALNEELAAMNEELASAIEEMAATNEELKQTQESLHALNQELEKRVQRRTAEVTLERDKLTRLFMDAPAGICIFAGPELVFELVNPTYQQLLPKREVLGRQLFEALPEIMEQPVEQMLRTVYATGTPIVTDELHVPLMTPTGQHLVDRYFNLNFQPRHDADGKVDGVMAFVYEVTQLVEARKRAERSEHDLRAVVMTSHYPLMVLRGRDNLIDIANEQLAALWDKPLDTVLGHKLLDVLPEIADQPFPALLKQVYDTGVGYGEEEQVFYLNTDEGQKTKYVSFYYDPLKEEGGEVGGIIVAASDITQMVTSRKLLQESYERQQSLNEEVTATNEELAATNEELQVSNQSINELNAELRESEERFRIMAEGSNVMIAVGDEKGAAVYFNEPWSKVTGRTPSELMKFGWVDLMHPDDHVRVMKAFTDAFAKQEPWEWEFRMPDGYGGWLWLLARGAPRFRVDGSFAGYISSCIDITARKQEEQRKNDFIGMVSHELKTPLTSMSAYVQMLLGKAKKADDQFTAKTLEKANNQVKKMTGMINGFLNVSRLESGNIHMDKTSFDMADLVKEVEEETIVTISSHHVVFAPVIKTCVLADRSKIGQVINNYISNAIKYSPTGSTIEVACVTIGNSAQVSVKDDGFGIKAEDQPKLFDRFYRVQNPETHTISGFGIGLYLCAEIIHRHEGRIWVESDPGKGSTFYFSIPLE